MKVSALLLASLLSITSVAIQAEEVTQGQHQATEKTDKAAPKLQTYEEIFAKLDIDGDQKISMKEAEVSPALTKGFSAIDTNKDGFLTKQEFANLWARAAKKRDRLAMANSASL